mmetsp:Transcript_14458/g.21736  ORF Transcript_14458/g.21736 Transcript_14458/m.21736 type:complete len:369 (-) Transcript_14458:280-1386(-)
MIQEYQGMNSTDHDGEQERSTSVSVHENNSDSGILQVKPILLPSNRVALVAVKDTDNTRLITMCQNRTDVDATLGPVPLMVQLLNHKIDSCVEQTVQTPLANTRLPPKQIHAKYISKTTVDSYRVQISAGSNVIKNRKFSRNVKNEIDALWLCEYALIFLDSPTNLEEIVSKGNYECLLQRGLVASTADYGNKLHEQLPDFEHRDILKRHEYERIADTLQRYVPYTFMPFLQPDSGFNSFYSQPQVHHQQHSVASAPPPLYPGWSRVGDSASSAQHQAVGGLFSVGIPSMAQQPWNDMRHPTGIPTNPSAVYPPTSSVSAIGPSQPKEKKRRRGSRHTLQSAAIVAHPAPSPAVTDESATDDGFSGSN